MASRKGVGVRQRRPNKKGPTRDPNDTKAWLVEKITQWLFEHPAVDVDHDMWVPTTDGEGKRQIDVLIRPRGSTDRSTWTVIECKNYEKAIDLSLIDNFVGALADIGVPSNRGHFVAVNGYEKSAKRRARNTGIVPLQLTGIDTVARLTAAVYGALQSVVFLVADIADVTLVNDISTPLGNVYEGLTIHGDQGQLDIPDLVWAAWRDGAITESLGQNVVSLDVPDSLYSVINGEKQAIQAMGVVVNVVGYVQTIEGEANQHSLIEAAGGQIYRYGLRVNFLCHAASMR